MKSISLVKRNINELKSEFGNPRKISKEKLKSLKKSLTDLGDFGVIVIDDADNVICGNQRIKAMKDLGMTKSLDCKQISGYSDSEKKAINLRANQHSGEWVFDDLESWLQDLNDDDFDLDLTGFDESLLDEMNLNLDKDDPLEVARREEIEDEIPSVDDNIVIKRGDLIQIGPHKILCGDATNPDDVKCLMGDEKANMVFTDPPYNVKIDRISNLGKTKHDDFVMASGEMTIDEFVEFLKKAFTNYVNHSTDGSIHYICMDWKHVYEITKAAKKIYTQFKQLCVWNKDNGGMGIFYRSKHELVFVYKNGEEKHINNFKLGATGRYRTNVWDYAGANSYGSKDKQKGDTKLHPTVKPIELVSDAILDCPNEGHLILDLFLGSGSTVIASEKTGRVCYGMELSEHYCQVIIERVLKYMNTNKLKINGKETIWEDYKKCQ